MIVTLVILFFYLKSGRALAAGLAGFVAPGSRERIMTLANEAWDTLGAYFRGQLLVAQQVEGNVLQPLILLYMDRG